MCYLIRCSPVIALIIVLGRPVFSPSNMMKSTLNRLSDSMSVECGWPVILTDVVTIGVPISSAMVLIQWFGIRTPIVPVPTDGATAFLFASLKIIVY